MSRYIAAQFGTAALTLLGASILSFVLLRVLPGDPARLIAGPLASEEAEQAIFERLGLDKPLHEQYYIYTRDFLRGDWGFSFSAGQPVRDQMLARFPATLELGFYAFLFAFVTALILALLATYRRWPLIDGAVRAVSTFGLGTPPFWLALLLLLLFFEVWGVLPGPSGRLPTDIAAPPAITRFYTIDALLTGRLSTFWQAVRHLILPAFALGLLPLAYLVRLLRGSLLEVAQAPFVTVVEAKGIGRLGAHLHHVLPNAFLPTLTASGLLLAQLLTGSVLIEQLFNWPGVGDLVVDAILRQDYAVVQAFMLISTLAYVLINLLVDLLYGVIDPRTRVQEEA